MFPRLVLVCWLGFAVPARAQHLEEPLQEAVTPAAASASASPALAPRPDAAGRLSAFIERVMHRERGTGDAAPDDDPVEEIYAQMGNVLRVGIPILVLASLLRHLLPVLLKRAAQKRKAGVKKEAAGSRGAAGNAAVIR
jgi:hypothetical protein